MKLAQFSIGTHDPACTGCPVCSELAAAILANPTNPVLSEAMGRPALRTLAERELRLATTTPLVEDKVALMRVIGEQLKLKMPELERGGFMRVVTVDTDKGTGTYEADTTGGKVRMFSFTFELDGNTVILKTAEDGTPSDAYAAPLAAMRAAAATPESKFAEQFKAERLRDLAGEYARADADDATRPATRTLSAAERAEFAPPNGYQIALDAMKKENR